MCVYVPTYLYVCLHADACRGQNLESCPLEKELQVVVCCLSWVLGMAPCFSVRATSSSLCVLFIEYFSFIFMLMFITYSGFLLSIIIHSALCDFLFEALLGSFKPFILPCKFKNISVKFYKILVGFDWCHFG